MHAWDSYADKVLAGDIVVGKYVRLAVQRYKDDLERQSTEDFPYYFDEKKAMGATAFFQPHLGTPLVNTQVNHSLLKSGSHSQSQTSLDGSVMMVVAEGSAGSTGHLAENRANRR